MMLNKFQRVVERIMTPEEAKERCEEMNLAPKVTEWIVKEFKRVNDLRDDPYHDGDPDEGADNGRIAYGMSWDYVFDQLGEVMGYTQDEVGEVSDGTDHPLNRVFNAFFLE